MPLNTQHPLAITMGDPAGCGPAIMVGAWHALQTSMERPLYVVGPEHLYDSLVSTQSITHPREASEVPKGVLPVFSIGFEDVPPVTPGHPDELTAPAIIQSIKCAAEHALSGQAAGVVTNPINKALLYRSGFTHPGHTEYIAQLCARPGQIPPTPVMMLVGGGLKVALATIHMPLIDVPAALTEESLTAIATAVNTALRKDFAIDAPKIAFTGLNPHAGESGTIGTEEQTTINPTAGALRNAGIDISDARSADTVFAESLSGQFDAVIAMTHDQGLIPVKTLDFWGGVNITLGLPIVRTSPDHGTAYEAAAADTCKPDSLIAAIRLANTVAINRARANA